MLFLEVVTFRRSVSDVNTLDKISERIMGKTWLLLSESNAVLLTLNVFFSLKPGDA